LFLKILSEKNLGTYVTCLLVQAKNKFVNALKPVLNRKQQILYRKFFILVQIVAEISRV